MNQRFHRRFSPKTLFSGLGCMVFGGVVLGLEALVGVLPMGLLVPGMIAVPAGVLIALSSWGRACPNCHRQTRQARIGLSGATKTSMKQALQTRDAERVATTFLERGTEPILFNLLEVKVFWCQECRNLVELKVAGWPTATFEGVGAARVLDAGEKAEKLVRLRS